MHVYLAYIDPGSGSLMIQALVASVVAIPFLLRRHIGHVVERIRGGEPQSDAATAPSESAKDH